MICEIKNLSGEVVLTYDINDERLVWGNYDLSGVNLEKANLEGVIWMDVILRRANLKRADFYWAVLFGSNLSETDCEDAEFAGTDLKQVNFTKANLRNAVFGKGNLGGSTDVSGAIFVDAILDGAKFDETRCNEKTIFPKKFNPAKNGLICIETE